MRTLILLAALTASLHAQTPAAENLNAGVRAFKSGDYAEAADRFQSALALDPSSEAARLYLATSYMQQFVPGADGGGNRAYADAAIQEFRAVFGSDPKSLLAAQSLASIYYNMKEFRNAEEWNHQVLALDPNNAEAYYTLGVVPWTEFVNPDRKARNNEHMKPEDPPPLKDPMERETLKAQFWQSLTEGIEYEKQALAIRPTYADAMAYLNLLIRYRADLEDSPEQAQADVKEADAWVGKALEMQKRRQ